MLGGRMCQSARRCDQSWGRDTRQNPAFREAGHSPVSRSRRNPEPSRCVKEGGSGGPRLWGPGAGCLFLLGLICRPSPRLCLTSPQDWSVFRGGQAAPGRPHCTQARPRAPWTGGPVKGRRLTIKTVVSDHIDLFPFSFCPFTVWLESVLILFVSFSHC